MFLWLHKRFYNWSTQVVELIKSLPLFYNNLLQNNHFKLLKAWTLQLQHATHEIKIVICAAQSSFFLLHMHFQVIFETSAMRKSAFTDITLVWFFSRVYSHVRFQLSISFKCGWTAIALKWFLMTVSFSVFIQISLTFASEWTQVTFDCPFFNVSSLVCHQIWFRFAGKSWLTYNLQFTPLRYPIPHTPLLIVALRLVSSLFFF